MSKSLGNFSTIDGLLGTFSADTIRLFVLQTHYRHPIDFSIDSLKSAATAMGRLLRAARFAEDTDSHKNGNEIGNTQDDVTEALHKEFIEAMNNDFNTAQAVSALFSFADKIFNLKGDEKKQQEYARVLKSHAMVLGLTLEDNRQQLDSDTSAQLVELLLNLRDRARQNKDYQASDFIRDQLADRGISVMDSKEGATWEKA